MGRWEVSGTGHAWLQAVGSREDVRLHPWLPRAEAIGREKEERHSCLLSGWPVRGTPAGCPAHVAKPPSVDWLVGLRACEVCMLLHGLANWYCASTAARDSTIRW